MDFWAVLESPAWGALESVGTVAAVAVAAWAALKARASARDSTAAATGLIAIESQRRHSELSPQLRVKCEPLNPGSDVLRLRIMLVGPAGLDRLDRLTVTIRNDHFLRGEGHQPLIGDPTQEEIRQHIWGPYRFTPRTGPNNARANKTGRETVYDASLPLGEELPYQLEPTTPAHWMTGMTQPGWLRQCGTVIRLAFIAEHKEHGIWYLPAEIDTTSTPVTVYVPLVDSRGK